MRNFNLDNYLLFFMDLANASYLRDTDLKLIVNDTDRVVKGEIIRLNFVIRY
jgi:hypothetical protein